ncbi:hypothetical protein H5410_001050 [Solanum commersonii]|uniref:Uncharacterized protein n=1 Tax=Solanum commersonii TaxID=4109 RepID=A0A9J6AXK3_SOLCO|nr:hypothetical protein H5410_001050 [Solanum commersonii]
MSTCKLPDSQYNLRSKGKMTDKDDFNTVANIMIPIENPEGSRNMTDIQNKENMARIEQELEILREELRIRRVRDLAKLSATIFPTFKTPIYFAKADLPSADLPNQPEQTQHALTHGRVPPASPTAVRIQILGTHVATPYEPHVPPIYAAGVLTFTTPVMRLRIAGVLQPVEEKLPDSIPRNFDGNKRGVIKYTPTPPNVKNNPLPNHDNQEVNMVTLDDEYGTPDYPNIDEADAMTSSAQPVITVQLRKPLTVQTYLPRVVVTTLIAKKAEYDTKVVPWDYLIKPGADDISRNKATCSRATGEGINLNKLTIPMPNPRNHRIGPPTGPPRSTTNSSSPKSSLNFKNSHDHEVSIMPNLLLPLF